MVEVSETKGKGGRPLDEARHREVLDVASQVFLEKGFDAASVREITSRLGIRSGSLYHYVKTKEELLYKIVQDVYSDSLQNMEQIKAMDGDPVEKLRRLIYTHALSLTSNPMAALAIIENKSLAKEHKRAVKERHVTYLSGFSDLISDGKAEGLIRESVDPYLTTVVIIGALCSIKDWSGWSDRTWTPDEVAAHFSDTLVDGLLV